MLLDLAIVPPPPKTKKLLKNLFAVADYQVILLWYISNTVQKLYNSKIKIIIKFWHDFNLVLDMSVLSCKIL